MNQSIVRISKWFWPWQDDKEEAWLEELSRQGLHLKRAANSANMILSRDNRRNLHIGLTFRTRSSRRTKMNICACSPMTDGNTWGS